MARTGHLCRPKRVGPAPSVAAAAGHFGEGLAFIE